MPKKSNKEEFISKSIKIHGDKYEYSLVDYINNKVKVEIICKIHGIFEQKPNNHLNGQNCYHCGNKIKDNKLRSNVEEFVEKSNKIHGNLYDYSLVEYISTAVKVKIICKYHGTFKQIPSSHLKGAGCDTCGRIIQHNYSRIKTKKNIIIRFKETHGDRYDYNKVNYIDAKTKVKIICKKHGQFEQIPHNHLNGQHCPKCSISKGVETLCKILVENKIKYKLEQTIPGCISDKNMLLRFDIHIPKLNIYIEYDGEQHFRPVEIWGGEKSFIELKKRDNIKNKFCINNGIKLFRISYKDNIEEKVKYIITS